MLLILLAPALSLVALVTGAVATVAGIVLNGPKSLRRERNEESLVLVPPVLCPDMPEDLDEEIEALAAL